MAMPPITHEMSTAGPATSRASCGANSQPEPMIEPIEAQVRPIRPTSRLRAKLRCRGSFCVVDMPVTSPPRPDRAPGPDRR